MKVAGRSWASPHQFGTLLFDLADDPQQQQPRQDDEVEDRLLRQMVAIMQENDAPAEQYTRLGFGGVCDGGEWIEAG